MLSWSVCDPWMSEWSRHCKSTGLTKKYPRNEANWIAYRVSALKSLHARRQHYKTSGSQVRSLNLQGDRGWLRHEQVTRTGVEAPKIFIPEWTVSRDDLSQLITALLEKCWESDPRTSVAVPAKIQTRGFSAELALSSAHNCIRKVCSAWKGIYTG